MPMPYDPDDPRLTAYVLGELDDPAEIAAVEAQLSACADSRRTVDEVRAMAGLLAESLRVETAPGLAPEQRRAIEHRLSRVRLPRIAYGLAGLALAASLLVAATLAYRASHAEKQGDSFQLAQGAPAILRSPAPAAPAPVGPAAPAGVPAAEAVADAVRPPAPLDVVRELDQLVDRSAPADRKAGEVERLTALEDQLARGRGDLKAARSSAPAVVAAPAPPATYAAPVVPAPADPNSFMYQAPVAMAPVATAPTQMSAALSPDGRTLTPPTVVQNGPVPASGVPAPLGNSAPAPAAGAGIGGMGGGMGGPAGAAGFGGRPGAQPGGTPATLAKKLDSNAPARPTSRSMMMGRVDQYGAGPAAEAGPDAGQDLAGLHLQGGQKPNTQQPAARGYQQNGQPSAGQNPGQADQAPAPSQALGLQLAQRAEKGAQQRGLAAEEREVAGRRLRKKEAVLAEGLAQDAEQAAAAPPAPPEPPVQAEAFAPIVDNPFVPTAQDPFSTFAIDVDTAGYANVRRYLVQGGRPPKDAAKVEEMINYFRYDYPQPKDDAPFAVDVEVTRCPWAPDHRLARIGLKGREIDPDKRPASNLVFLVDVSGSMNHPDKLPLVQEGLRMLVEQLGENDRIALAVYAAQEGLVLPATHGDNKAEILSAINQLQAGGSTNGGKGLELAYKIAEANLIPDGVNRVLLATDGDFNVGITDNGDLERFVEAKRKTGVALSVLGFGQGNTKNDRMEMLADKGNGQYCFIDSRREARKVLVEQMAGTLTTIAKDVKIQVEFNPLRARAFRLLGYENRLMKHEEFRDDKKDAGEIGAGHTVTALYEVIPADAPKEEALAASQPRKYSKAKAARVEADAAGEPQDRELMTVFLRYKAPNAKEEDKATEIERAVVDDGRDLSRASDDTKFAAAVAGFGLILRDSPYKGTATFGGLHELAGSALGPDPGGYRKEFLTLVEKARAIWGQ